METRLQSVVAQINLCIYIGYTLNLFSYWIKYKTTKNELVLFTKQYHFPTLHSFIIHVPDTGG